MKYPLASLLLLFTTGFLAAGIENPYRLPQPKNAPEELMVIIEIPQGSINKYEIDEKTGLLILDRVISMPVAYPTNYGAFSQTLAGDGDPLDALVFSRAPIQAGVLVRVRPIGILRMIDGGEQDDKILCVPVNEVDPSWDEVKTIADLPKAERDRIEAFFRIYKDLPHGRKKVELKGGGGAEEAKEVVKDAIERHRTEGIGRQAPRRPQSKEGDTMKEKAHQ